MSDVSGNRPLRNIGIALLGIWLAIVVYAFLYQIAGVLTIHDFVFRPWGQIKAVTFYQWTPWILLAPLVHFLARKFPLRPEGWLRIILIHLVFMSGLALVHAFVASLVYYTIGYFDPGMENYKAWQHTGHYLFMNDMYLMDCFVYSVLMASVSLRAFYELAKNKALDAERSQTQLVASRLQTLKMQVSPHFLFNTLNSIAVLIRKQDNAGAERMLAKLSDFFRMTLEQGEEQLVTVADELRLISKYLEIEQVRFGDRLVIDYRVDDDCLQERLPVLLLQPLVENAIKHGLSKKPGQCRITISIRQTPEGMRLNVTDDGGGLDKNPKTDSGVGLGLIQARLAALYADRARFSFHSESGRGASVNIFLPASGEVIAV